VIVSLLLIAGFQRAVVADEEWRKEADCVSCYLVQYISIE